MAKFVLTAQLQLQGPSNVRQVVNQIQSQLKGVNVDVNLKGGPQAQRQLQQITNQSNKAATAASSMGKALGISIRRFTGLAIATRAVSLFTNSLGSAVKESIAFERELVKISQVTGKTVSQLKDLTNTITSLATGLGVSSTSLLQTSRILSQAGLSARETEIALKALAKTELAPTFDNIGATAEGAVAIFNQFRQGAGALEGQLGSLNAVAGKFAVESGDLISVIRRTGGVFKAAGGDLNQLIALFTSVRSTTRESAESIATGLRTILTRIQRPRTIEYLRQYGVELETLEGKFVGPYEAIRRLSQATAGLEQGDLRFIEIAEEIAGFRQIGKVIPLLREFRVAQEALVVAQGGVNSLTDDAAKAQLSLAVRITKVKEEFLSLVRSVTETTTFQVMAATVLTLAESLIKLGEAIKPILPLLSALVAFRALKGFGNFLGAIPKGFGNARGFASGGMVPGTGNRDTVPAMLTPGEFVIKKSSVAKLGAGNLAAMNENRYADGGPVGRVSVVPGSVGGFYLKPQQGTDRPDDYKFNPFIMNLTNRSVQKRYGLDAQNPINYFLGLSKDKQKNILYGDSPGGSKFAKLNNRSDIKAIFTTAKNATGKSQRQAAQQKADLFKSKGFRDRLKKESSAMPLEVSGSISSFFPGKDELKKTASVYSAVSLQAQKILTTGTNEAAKNIANFLNVGNKIKLNANTVGGDSIASDPAATSSVVGYLFEGIIQALSGASLSGGQAPFDFTRKSISGARQGLANLFTGGDPNRFAGLQVADAKADYGLRSKIPKKIAADINQGNTSGYIFGKFATGGPVGTDTVPALLTPGEFVVNRSSAKAIGYSNLKRMNQVGRYAAGGIVSHNRHAYGNAPATMGAPGSIPGMAAGQALEKVAQSANDAAKSMSEAEGAGKKVARFGLYVVAAEAALSSLRPTIDETSSYLEKGFAAVIDGTSFLISSFTSLAATMALFGVQIELATVKMAAQNAMDIGGDLIDLVRGRSGGRTAARISKGARGLAQRGGKALQGLGTRFGSKALRGFGQSLAIAGPKIGKLAVGATKLASGIGAAALAAEGLALGFNYLLDNTEEVNKAIQEGDVEKAGQLVQGRKTGDVFSERNVGTASGAVGGLATGALIGSMIPVIGTAIGAAIGGVGGALYGWMTSVDESAITQARAAAAVVKANKDLAKSAEDAAGNIKDFQAGKIDEAEFEKRSATAAANMAAKEQIANIDALEKGQTRSFFNPMRLFGSSSGQNSEAIAKQGQEALDLQKKAFAQDEQSRNAVLRSRALEGRGLEGSQYDPNEYFKKAQEYQDKALAAEEAGQADSAKVYRDLAKQQMEAGNQVIKSYANISDSVNRAREKFDALNLGLNQSAGAIGGANLGLQNLIASTDANTPKLENSIRTLDASTTAAAAGISAADFGKALDDASNTLLEYGADPAQVQKFRNNQAAIASAQKELPSVIARVRDDIKSAGLTGMTPERQQELFKEKLEVQLESLNMDPQAIKNIVNSLPDIEDLSPEQKAKLKAGDFSVFENQLNDIGKKQLAEVKKQLEEAASVQKQVIELTKRRIEAENKLIQAQQQAIDISMEARGYEAQFGGAPVTTAERRQAVAARSNVLGRAAGLSDVGTDVASFRRRREEIRAGFSATQLAPGQQQTPENAAQADRLRQAQQDQVKSLRELIKIQQDEIKTIQEKQRLEKESLDSLLTGDIDKFFEQQAAQGAIAAAATGNAQVMGAFGADATAAAAKELQRLQAAGVTEIYGQQIGGAGGLAETTALAGFRQRGLSGQAAVRASQIQAGTTQDILDRQKTGRELTAELAAAGDLGADMAADELSVAAQALQQAAYDISNAINQSGASTQRGILTGQRFENERQVAAQQSIVNDAQAAAIAKEEEATRAQAQFNKSKYAGMSNQELLSLPTDEYNQAMRMRTEARYDLPREAEALRSQEASQQSELRRRQLQGQDIQRQFEATGPAGFSVGGLDEQSTETLNNFANSVQSLQGMEVAHKLGDMNINFGGVDFLANMQPEIRNTVIDELQTQLENYRPSSAGMRKNNSVLPTS